MNISRTNIDELNAVIKLSIEKSDYEATVNETLKDYRKKANMPGFRKGMVPAGLIKKMYGKAVLAEEINKILSKELNRYISEENLQILGEPLPNETEQKTIDFDHDENFEFVFDLGFSPAIVIDFKKLGKLPLYEIAIDEEMINNQVEAFQNRFGNYVDAEVSTEKDNLIGSLKQLDEKGAVLEGGIQVEEAQVSIQLVKTKKLKSALLGKKAGDIIKFNPAKAFDDKHYLKQLLKIEDAQAESLTSDFELTVSKVNTFVPAELNEEMFKKSLGGETNITTPEQFKEKIAEDLKENLRYSTEYRFLVDTKEALTKYVGMKLPVEFLKRWLVYSNEKITREQVDEEFDLFVKDLEWTLIRSRLAKDNDLKVSEADLVALAKETALMQFRQYGMFSVPDEYLDNYAKSILKNEEERHHLVEKRSESMVLEFIKNNADLEVKTVTQKAFDDLFEK
ncbi:MAG: trigger factor [Bacteroidetes bacterium]|nr:trigger factor [Bacteroidota bacterium]MCL6102811.1 trigger factor [Bacteroidota bacterium]